MLYDLVMKYLYPYSSTSSSSQVPLLTAPSTSNKDNDEENDDLFIKTNPIFLKDLQQVKLKPWSMEQHKKYHLQKYGRINVQSLSNKQLNDIMNVKLRKTITKAPQTVFEIRHPCLRELLERRLVQP